MKHGKLLWGVLFAAVLMSGCAGAGQRSAEATALESETGEENAEDTAQPESAAATESGAPAEAAAGDAYAAFLAGEQGVRFDDYMEHVFRDGEYLSYTDETISRIPSDRAYTLSELADTLNDIFDTEEYYYADGEVTSMQYAFLDCGADGEKELALLIVGPFVEPESEMTLLIKEREGELQVIYAYASWSRSFTEINEYGLIGGGGSNGASNHGWDESYINADGIFTYGYYEEQEYDLSMFAYRVGQDEPDISGLEGNICVYSLRLDAYSEDNEEPQYYSYEVLSPDTYEVMDIPGLYIDTPYQQVMDSFRDIRFVSMDELYQVEEERMESLGVTDKIRSGGELVYTEIPMDVEAAQTDEVIAASVQEELAWIEAQSEEIANRDWAYMPQQEMNLTTGEWYKLWDDELNSLWSRITEEMDPADKEALLQEERAWVEQKEAAVTEAGQEALGGTLQPQLENGTAMRYTRKRAYELAAILADLRGESFLVPADVQESFQELDEY